MGRKRFLSGILKYAFSVSKKKEIIKRTKKIYENGERMSKKTSNMDGKKIVGEPDASCLNQSPATWWVSRSKLRTWAER